MEKITVRSFNREEINEINRYVLTNVPFSVLNRLFILTENLKDKATIFTIIYRIINSCKNYVGDEKTKNKLKFLLDDCKSVYLEVYNNLILYEKGGFGSGIYYNKLVELLTNKDNSIKINNLIDIFLIFAEKQVIRDLDRVTGIDSSRKEGEEIVDEIIEEKEL